MSSEKPDGNTAVWRRKKLPRNSKSLRLVLRPKHFAKLQNMASTDRLGRKEPLASVVERLIDGAELPAA